MTTPAIRQFSPAFVPQQIKDQKRWAPWRAVLNEKRQKYDKIPHNPKTPNWGVSTHKVDQWGTFDQALAAYKAHPDVFAGLGYVMTGAHGIIGVDLDNCIDKKGQLAPWAREVVDQLASYTEISPSGKGLRILVAGEMPNDWNNHDVGIEVYGGNEARFLTITGSRLADSPATICPDNGAIKALEKRYAKERRKAEVIDLNMPELLPDYLLPDLESLDIPYQTRDFLTEGLHSGDRSRAVFAAGVALYQAGLSDDEVFSLLAGNDHVMAIALDHRRQDHDRALLYIWREHCCKGKSRASETKALTEDEFDIVPEGEKEVKDQRFKVFSADEFLKRKPISWIIKGILPRAELAVLYGDSGSGKSFFALDMVATIGQGLAWRGRKTNQGHTVYIAAEGAAGFRNRIQAYADHHGITPAGMNIGVIPDAPNLMEKSDIKDLIAAIKTFGHTDIVVVDTFAQAFRGNENSGEDMGRALGHCKAIHKATGALVMLVAHSGKDSSRGVRGWSGLRGAADVQIEIVRNGDHRAAIIDKQKDGSGEGDEYGFRLNTVSLGADDDGEDITSCVIVESDTRASAKAKEPKGGNNKLVTRVLAEIQELDSAPVSINTLIEAVVAQLPFDSEAGKRDRRRDVAMRSIGALIDSGLIKSNSGFISVVE